MFPFYVNLFSDLCDKLVSCRFTYDEINEIYNMCSSAAVIKSYIDILPLGSDALDVASCNLEVDTDIMFTSDATSRRNCAYNPMCTNLNPILFVKRNKTRPPIYDTRLAGCDIPDIYCAPEYIVPSSSLVLPSVTSLLIKNFALPDFKNYKQYIADGGASAFLLQDDLNSCISDECTVEFSSYKIAYFNPPLKTVPHIMNESWQQYSKYKKIRYSEHCEDQLYGDIVKEINTRFGEPGFNAISNYVQTVPTLIIFDTDNKTALTDQLKFDAGNNMHSAFL